MDETPEQRAIRLAGEEQARNVSAAIDASIKAERNARRKKRIVRLLLLGQSESGGLTYLISSLVCLQIKKQASQRHSDVSSCFFLSLNLVLKMRTEFQRLYTPTAFREERVLWRAVIQLNVVRSIRTILDALDVHNSPESSPYSSPRNHTRSLSQHPPLPDLPGATGVVPLTSVYPAWHPDMHLHRDRMHAVDSDGGDRGDFDGDYDPYVASGSTNKSTDTDSRSQDNISSGISPSSPQLHQYHHHYQQQAYSSNHIQVLKLRLSPIRHIEQVLINRLVPPSEEEPTHLGDGSIGGNPIHFSATFGAKTPASSSRGEVFVRPTTGWRGALSRARVSYPSFFSGAESDRTASSDNSSWCESGNRSSSDREGGTNEAQETLNTLCGDMIQLWQDADVREVLKRKRIRLEEESGFFLNDLHRITSLRYVPSDGML